MATLHESMRGVPVAAGDLADALESLEERFARIENALGEIVGVLDDYPSKMGAAFDQRIQAAFADLAAADNLRGELEPLMAERPHFKEPMKRNLLFSAYVANPHMSLSEIADRLESELFGMLKAEGVPAEEAKEVASSVGDQIEAAMGGAEGDRAKQEEKDREGVRRYGGKVGKGLLTRLAGGPGARPVEHGGMPKVKSSRAGSSSDFRRPGDKDWQK